MAEKQTKSPLVTTIREEREIHRITMRRFLRSIPEAFEIERGVVYTLRRLGTQPGHLILDYLGRWRYHYVPPFRLLLVTTAMVLIILNYSSGVRAFVAGVQEALSDGPSEEANRFQRMQELVVQYHNLILWMYLPIGALFTLLFNRHGRLNYAEHLVFHTYLLALSNLLVVVFLLNYLMPLQFVLPFYVLAILGYYLVAYQQVFGKSWGRSVLELGIVFVLSYAIYGLMVFLVIGLYVFS